jgi:hypothetical protein
MDTESPPQRVCTDRLVFAAASQEEMDMWVALIGRFGCLRGIVSLDTHLVVDPTELGLPGLGQIASLV